MRYVRVGLAARIGLMAGLLEIVTLSHRERR